METCYKAVRADLVKSLPLRADRFGIEPELTARLAQAGARIYELPISYHGRTYAEGKKIGWKDGVAALWYIIRFNLFGPKTPLYRPAQAEAGAHAPSPTTETGRGAHAASAGPASPSAREPADARRAAGDDA